MSHFLANKTAIVTGGSGTIGKAIARSLLAVGCDVVITGRNQKRLDDAVADLSSGGDGGSTGKVRAFACDVTKEDDVKKLFASLAAGGGVNLLVNNAGTATPGATVDLSPDDFRFVMDVNVLGPFLCSKHAIRSMTGMDHRGDDKVPRLAGGRIINIGSISAISPRPDGCPYTTSKFALLGLTHSLSLDCRKHDIAVGIVHPGNVKSAMLSPEEMKKRGDAEGFIAAEDVANCVLAMASLPYNANVLEMTVIPTKQPLVGRG